MGLMDREYMYETFEEKKTNKKKYNTISGNLEEIFRLSNKKHITFIDKIRISRLMDKNRKLMDNKQK